MCSYSPPNPILLKFDRRKLLKSHFSVFLGWKSSEFLDEKSEIASSDSIGEASRSFCRVCFALGHRRPGCTQAFAWPQSARMWCTLMRVSPHGPEYLEACVLGQDPPDQDPQDAPDPPPTTEVIGRCAGFGSLAWIVTTACNLPIRIPVIYAFMHVPVKNELSNSAPSICCRSSRRLLQLRLIT